MRLAPALVVAVTAASLAVGPAAAADSGPGRDYAFPDTCDAASILTGVADCVDGTGEIDLHADGSVTFVRETAYPREAFDAYLEKYEDWTGTTEEYLEASFEDSDDAVETSVTDELLLVRITSELSADGGALLMGVALASDGDLYTSIDMSYVEGFSLVTLTAPGTVETANGTIDGLTVTWDEAALAELDELAVHALTSVEGSGGVLPGWMIPVGVGLLVLLAVAGFLGFARRPRSTGAD